MISARQNLFFLIFSFELALFCASQRVFGCNNTCGSTTVSFPFGFSDDCPIPLNCSATGEVQLRGYRIINFTSGAIILDVPPACNRPAAAANELIWNRNYAMTSSNALFMLGCSRTTASPACSISTEIVSRRLNLSRCGLSGDISCFSSGKLEEFLAPAYSRAVAADCQFFFEPVRDGRDALGQPSLVFSSAEIGWWLNGECRCAANAECEHVAVPGTASGSAGFRCSCNEGFVGDGFADGAGCMKAEKFSASNVCGDRSKLGVLLGGVAAGASLLLVLVLFCHRLRRYLSTTISKEEQTAKCLISQTSSAVSIYSHRDVERATSNFSDASKLGAGAYATVYIGKFPNTGLVAIKRLRHPDNDHFERVINEVKLISSVSHPNLVHLLGCCIDGGEHILVYEFMPNGTLSQHLRRERGDGLSWPARVSIAADTAKAIVYLHTAVQPPIYHRDIKSSNILLDYDLRPKLADFGLSRTGIMAELSHISTAPQGTPGYVDPQYHQNFHLSDRSDVYSFGVVLVEMMTAMKVVDFCRAPGEVNLASLASEAIRKGMVEDIVDPFIKEKWDGRTKASVQRVAELAFRCLAFHSDARPAMAEVAGELERISKEEFCSSDQSGSTLGEERQEESNSTRLMEKSLVASSDSAQNQWPSEHSCSSNGSSGN
ncbi:wall-associated receptor kinase-like 14 [Canna indica]|uniref:Wall-associated receptor kinase-like 14 n=1 Tax=Canna indica TaxID=4628 RepID=A0AAQ3JKZ9_9LILI|nr:wall-associated receptor kinase-like 14 [Canna indica]